MANILKALSFHLIALLSHPFTTYFKRIFEQCGLPVKNRFFHLLECTLLFLVLLRLASFAMQLTLGYHLSWDPLGQYLASQRHLYDAYLLACEVSLVLYTLTLNWKLFLSKKREDKPTTWQSMAYDLIVRNAEQATKCSVGQQAQKSSRQLKQASASKRSSLSPCLHQITSRILQKHLDLGKLAQTKYQLAIFTFLSAKTRKKLLQFQYTCNLIAKCVPLLNLLVPLLGLALHIVLGVLSTSQRLPLIGWSLLLSDLTLLWIYSYLFYRNALLLLYFVLILSLAIWYHLRAVHRLLAFFSVKYRSRKFPGLNPWNRLLLRNALTEHAQLCTLLDVSNGQLFNLALLATFLFNAPTNIYLVYRLLYRPLLLTEFTVILVFINAQILSLTCVVLPLALVNGALARTAKYLPGLQLYVLRGGNCRSLKMKYEILQSTLTESRVKSGATIGPVCLITFDSLYKVVSLYAVYMLVLFDLLPK